MSTQAAAPGRAAQDRAPDMPPELIALRRAEAVRARCTLVKDWVAAGHSPHFTIDASRRDDAATLVADITRADYPDLVIPHHSRWRHFSAGGVDR